MFSPLTYIYVSTAASGKISLLRTLQKQIDVELVLYLYTFYTFVLRYQFYSVWIGERLVTVTQEIFEIYVYVEFWMILVNDHTENSLNMYSVLHIGDNRFTFLLNPVSIDSFEPVIKEI